jgi:hypothetical protein
MGKALTKEQQERLANMTTKPKQAASSSERKQFDKLNVLNVSINNRKGQFTIYKDGEKTLLGDSLKVRPIMFANKFMRQAKNGSGWAVESESVLDNPAMTGHLVSNDGTIACGRLLGKAAKGLDGAEAEINKNKATFYGVLYAIYDGDLVAIKMPSGKAMAMQQFMQESEDLPVSTEIELILGDPHMTINTSKLGLKVTEDELAAAEMAQEHIDQYNFFTVIAYNRSEERAVGPVDMVEYVSADFAEKYGIKKYEPKTNESYEAEDIPS